jgi:hypothetical protein
MKDFAIPGEVSTVPYDCWNATDSVPERKDEHVGLLTICW